MIETTNHEIQDSTSEEAIESFSPEAGGTSVSFRPGPARFLTEFERKPWWLAPGAIVMVPLLVMLLAAWAIPERIGSDDPASTPRLPVFGETRTPPSRNSSALDEEISNLDDGDSGYTPPSSGSRRTHREAASHPARRGFSPVREREESPTENLAVATRQAPPSLEDPEPSEEPQIARSNGTRGGRALSVVQRPEEPDSDAEPSAAAEPSAPAEPDAATEPSATTESNGAPDSGGTPEEAPATDVSRENAPAQSEGEADQNQER